MSISLFLSENSKLNEFSFLPIDAMSIEVHRDRPRTTRQMSRQWRNRHRLFLFESSVFFFDEEEEKNSLDFLCSVL
jgi:hypothetical protein